MNRGEERETLYIEDREIPSIFRVSFRRQCWRDRGGKSSLNIEFKTVYMSLLDSTWTLKTRKMGVVTWPVRMPTWRATRNHSKLHQTQSKEVRFNLTKAITRRCCLLMGRSCNLVSSTYNNLWLASEHMVLRSYGIPNLYKIHVLY